MRRQSEQPAAPRPGRFAWLNRDLAWIIAGRTIRSLSQGYLGVIVPLYLLRIGFTAVSLGQLFTVGAIVSAVLTLVVGLLADQVGRKPFLVIFPLLTAVAAVVFISTTNVLVLIAASAFGTLSRGGGAGGAGGGPFYPAEQALTADHARETERNRVFAMLSLSATLASAGGALLAGVPELLVHYAGMPLTEAYKPLFLLTSALSIVGALSILPVRERARRPAGRAAGPRRPFLPTKSRRVIGRLAVTNLVNGMGVGFYAPFVSYWFNQRFGEGPAAIGTLFAAVSLGAAVPYLFAPAFARRVGLVHAVVLIRMVGVVTLGALPLMPTFPLAAALYFVRMAFQRASIPLRQSYTMGVVDAAERSAAASISNLPSQLAGAGSPLLAGYIFDAGAMVLPFEIGTALQFLNAMLFLGLFRNIRPPEEAARSQAAAAGTSPPERPSLGAHARGP